MATKRTGKVKWTPEQRERASASQKKRWKLRKKNGLGNSNNGTHPGRVAAKGSLDTEVAAINVISDQLKDLDQEGRLRVVRFVAAHYDIGV